MKIVLRPGHGITPPAPLCYPAANRLTQWHRQRPGGYEWPGWPGRWYEDDYTAHLAAEVVPALRAAGHEVICQRALPGTPEGEQIVHVGREQLLQLVAHPITWAGPRWLLCASVEGVLRGEVDPRDVCGWSWDPQMSCLWERNTPGVDLYLSLHVNWWDAPQQHGVGAFHYPGSARGQAHAQRLLDGIKGACAAAGGDLAVWAAEDESAAHPWGSLEHQNLLSRGERWGRYTGKHWELKQTRAPAVILELGYASHRAESGPSDLDRLVSPAGRRALVAGIVEGLA